MVKTTKTAIILVILSTLFISVAQIFYKLAAEGLVFNISLLFNYHLFIGLSLYAIAALFLILALKRGELSVIYPMIAVSYLLVAILSYFVLGEMINFYKWIGIAFIIVGVGILGGRS